MDGLETAHLNHFYCYKAFRGGVYSFENLGGVAFSNQFIEKVLIMVKRLHRPQFELFLLGREGAKPVENLGRPFNSALLERALVKGRTDDSGLVKLVFGEHVYKLIELTLD